MSVMPLSHFHDMCRTDFATFVAKAMETLEPGTHYEENWHILALAYQLELVREGETLRLMINLPPRSMKTVLVSIAFTAWILGHDPTRRIICVTYSRELAKTQAILFRRLVTADWYKRVFPGCRPAVPNSLMEWRTSKGGYRIASSIDGSVLGRGADYIILDDPNKGQEIHSQVSRDKVKASYDEVISTRLNHMKTGAIICVMQRLHADDLAGHMLEQEEWTHIEIPAVAVEDERWHLGNDMIYHRPAGEPIQPARAGHEELAKRRRIMGETAYNAQYQQRPVPDDGVVIRRPWLRYYEAAPAEFEVIVASWDTASTLEEDSDWSVGTIWGLADGLIYLLHVERAKLEVPDLRHRIEAIHREWRADITLIEAADLGRGIAQDLNRSSQWCRPRLVQVRIDKIARMQARSVMFETGKVLLPHQAPWRATYLAELLGFPNARNDDQVDSTSQALDWFQLRHSGQITPERDERAGLRPAGRLRPRGRQRR